MKPEVKGIFGTLRECMDEEGAKLDKCLAKALLKAETKKHDHSLKFIYYYISRFGLTCTKVAMTVNSNKALLTSEEKRGGFSPKVLELLQTWKVCQSATIDSELPVKVEFNMLNEYKKRSN